MPRPNTRVSAAKAEQAEGNREQTASQVAPASEIKAEGEAVAADLIGRAKAEEGGYTLIPSGKVEGNKTVEAVLVDGEPVMDGDMQVVRKKK
jgi:regulator of protease activity HflC (stomatin/prohibitin superfamily)